MFHFYGEYFNFFVFFYDESLNSSIHRSLLVHRVAEWAIVMAAAQESRGLCVVKGHLGTCARPGVAPTVGEAGRGGELGAVQ